jgi:hypothetical protein
MDLAVAVGTDKSSYDYGETLDVVVTVRNVSSRIMFLVSQPRWHPAGKNRIEILLGEAAEGMHGAYYAYRMPDFRRVSAGASVPFSFSIGMPLHRPFIDRDHVYQEEEVPAFGTVSLVTRVAYLMTPFKPRTNDPLRELVARQLLTKSVALKIQVQKS